MHRVRRDGFTLIEILVVLTIVGVMIAGALLSLGVVGVDRSHERDAERLRAMLDYLRDRAELEGREYGVLLDEEGYRFLTFDPERREWQVNRTPPLRPARWAGERRVELTIDGRRVVLTARTKTDQGLQPQIGVDALGEFTQFSLRWPGVASQASLQLHIDQRGAVTLSQPDVR